VKVYFLRMNINIKASARCISLVHIMCGYLLINTMCGDFSYSYFEKLVDEIDIDSIVTDFASRNFWRNF
jgi:hypothetical protein